MYEITKSGMAHLNTDSQKVTYYEEQKAEHYQKNVDEFLPQIVNTSLIYQDSSIIGRLRLVKTTKSIHIGGIQLLPEWTGKGIGTTIFQEIITEPKVNKQIITLQVNKKTTKKLNFTKN